MRKTKKLGCNGYRSFMGLFMLFLLVSIGFLSVFPLTGIAAAPPPDLIQSRQEGDKGSGLEKGKLRQQADSLKFSFQGLTPFLLLFCWLFCCLTPFLLWVKNE